MPTTVRRLLRPALLLLAIAASFALAACGSDDEASSSASGSASTSKAVDAAFVDEMIPHHSSALDMAKIAQQRGRSEFVKSLAEDIVRTQTAEISTLRAAKAQQLAGVKAGELGVASHMMGMDSDMALLEEVAAANFDKVFVDMMIPHHRGAIRMARAELAKGAVPELKTLATAIIAAQSKEITEMNAFRTAEFGAASPAGGVPATDEPADDEKHGGGGGHGSGHSG